LAMLNLLEICRKKKLKPIVLFSGTVTEAGICQEMPVNETVKDSPITIYDIHKLMAETYLKHYCRQGFVRGAILRLANVYGPGAIRTWVNAFVFRSHYTFIYYYYFCHIIPPMHDVCQ